MSRLMAALFLASSIGLGMDAITVGDPYQPALEQDQDERAECLRQLLTETHEPLIAGIIIGTLNYVDRYHGGPCQALDHYRQHGWY